MDEKKLIFEKGEQPFAKISNETLQFLIAREFPKNIDLVKRKLEKIESTSSAGKNRISASVLKLADRDLGKVDYFIKIALEDFRDILSLSEYPRATSEGFEKRNKEENKIDYLKDWEEFTHWINKTK